MKNSPRSNAFLHAYLSSPPPPPPLINCLRSSSIAPLLPTVVTFASWRWRRHSRRAWAGHTNACSQVDSRVSSVQEGGQKNFKIGILAVSCLYLSCRSENVHVHGMGHPAESADGCPFRWNDPPTRFSWEPFTDKYRHRYFPPRSLARNHT